MFADLQMSFDSEIQRTFLNKLVLIDFIVTILKKKSAFNNTVGAKCFITFWVCLVVNAV